MPTWSQWIGNLFPVTYFVPIVRGLMTKGVGLGAIHTYITELFLYIVVIMLIATRAFKQGLD